MILAPDTVADVEEAVRGADRVLPRGGGTKPALSTAPPDTVTVDLRGLTGIVQYDPAELTLSAMAGTPVGEIAAALAEHGQHLPFDPVWAAAGATLGGTVAAATAGPGAFRHGGVRDFVLAVRFVDGAGRTVGGGAHVVKNAAGFDLSKLLVGSAGRLGILVRLSLKVFPAPPAHGTVTLEHPDLERALETVARLGRGPFELGALDVEPPGRVVVRLGGAAAALERRLARVLRFAEADADAATVTLGEAERRRWRAASELAWAPPGDRVLRVGLTARRVAAVQRCVAAHGAEARYSLGGNVGWIAWPADRPLAPLDAALRDAPATAMLLRGEPGDPLLVGAPPGGGAFADRIRAVLDPPSRFLEL